MGEQLRQVRKFDFVTLSYGFFLRILALICLASGCCYWIRLVGVFPGELWRIDHMPWQWQSLTSTLCVLYPVASLGLWMHSPWGMILWIFAAVIESVAFTFYSSIFAFMPLIAFFHFLFVLLFLLFQGLMFIKRRRKQIVITEY